MPIEGMGYDLQVRCENSDLHQRCQPFDPHEYRMAGSHNFYGATRQEAWREFKDDGWKRKNKTHKVYCPFCVLHKLDVDKKGVENEED